MEIPNRETDSNLRFESELGRKWLLIAGLVIMVIGIGYFLKYSFERNWLGPAARVIMSYAAGMILLFVGLASRRRSYELFGNYVLGGGIATLYFSTYAAFQIYHLVGQPMALFAMALVTITAGALAVTCDTVWLAVLGLVGGFLTPKLLGSMSNDPTGLLSYLTVLNAGILFVAFFKSWRVLNYAAFALTYAIFSEWYFRFYSPDRFWPAFLFLNAFFMIYSVAPFAYQFFGHPRDRLDAFYIITPNALIAFSYSFAMIRSVYDTEWAGAVSMFYSIVFFWLAQLQRLGRREPSESYTILLGQSILFFILTVPIVFSRHVVTIFWAIQGLCILWTGRKLQRASIAILGSVLVILAVCKFLFLDYAEHFSLVWNGMYFQNGYDWNWIERIATELTVLLCLLGAARINCTARNCEETEIDSKTWSIIFGFLLFLVLNLEVAAGCREFVPKGRFAGVTVLWTVFAISLMGIGIRQNAPAIRHVALTLFLLTILKVLFVDMARFSTPYRILSCLVLGLVLIGTSYLYHRNQDRLFGLTPRNGEKQDDRINGSTD